MSAQVAADLRAAAEVLKRDGWAQGVFLSRDGCRCVTQAIAFVVEGGDYSNEGEDDGFDNRRFSQAVSALYGYLAKPPTVWNDERGRTADEVIAALRAAADAAEAAQ